MLWEASREKGMWEDALEHQHRRIRFHEAHYNRPSFILAWCHEELGDVVLHRWPDRKWQHTSALKTATFLLTILCGARHQYTCSPWNKLCAATSENGSAS